MSNANSEKVMVFANALSQQADPFQSLPNGTGDFWRNDLIGAQYMTASAPTGSQTYTASNLGLT